MGCSEGRWSPAWAAGAGPAGHWSVARLHVVLRRLCRSLDREMGSIARSHDAIDVPNFGSVVIPPRAPFREATARTSRRTWPLRWSLLCSCSSWLAHLPSRRRAPRTRLCAPALRPSSPPSSWKTVSLRSRSRSAMCAYRGESVRESGTECARGRRELQGAVPRHAPCRVCPSSQADFPGL